MDVRAFRRAWESVVKRHAILRTAFLWEGLEEPIQVVRRQVELPWMEADWTDGAPDEQKQRWQKLLTEQRQNGFNLRQAPLLRFALIKLGDARHYFSWTYHHILLDGWCQHIVLREVFQTYESLRQGREPALDAPAPFRRYIGWLQKQDRKRAESFWRSELEEFTAPSRIGIELQSGAGREGEAEIAGAGRRLGRGPTEELNKLARQQKVTVNTVIQGAWGILLSRYNGEKDNVFGATVSGRSAPVSGIESMLGLFINTLPVRVQVDSGESVAAYLRRLQERQADAREYEYSPLLKVQEWSQIPRGSRLFDHILVFENVPVDAAARARFAEGMNIGELEFFEITNFPLALTIHPGAEMSFRCNFNRARFSRHSIELMLEHLEHLLGQMAAAPEQCTGSLSLLTEAETRRILTDWNKTGLEYPDKPVHQLFEEQAAETPDGVAVIDAEERVTYRELNRRANQLAHHLCRLGMKNEAAVGVCLRRGAEFPVAILAIMKAGCAYVPLDPGSPAERLDYIGKDAGIQAVITTAELAESMAFGESRIVCLDADGDAIAAQSASNLQSAAHFQSATPDSLAYVIYTSGSTGRPKGVLGLHRGVVNRCAWMRKHYPFQPREVCCQKTSISFVDSIAELLAPILSGVPVAVIPEADSKNPERLIGLLKAHRITRIVLVPSLLSAIMEAEDDLAHELPDLKLWVSSGEALRTGPAGKFHAMMPGRKLLNLYGSSEVAADATWAEAGCEDDLRGVRIGKPMSNTKVYVLDSEYRPVPPGIAGELHVAGAGLARGYLGRPGLTAEKFLPNPFAQNGGERMYRTGDHARWTAEGDLEFLGRRDNQVKIRGQRIELGEIEALLREHSAVETAVVTANEAENGDIRLAAYFSCKAGAEAPGSDALRARLKKFVPEYMVPPVFVHLQEMPLTISGKIDKARLPGPNQEVVTEAAAAPRNELELQLAIIWQDLLKVRAVGRGQSFFDLGGHSLLTIPLIRKIKEQFGREISLPVIFENPTIEQMAGVLQANYRASRSSHIVPIQRQGANAPLFFVHATGGGPLDYLHLSRLLGPEQPFYSFQAFDGQEEPIEPFLTIEERARQYIEALRQTQAHGPYQLGGWSFGAYVAYEMAQQLFRQGEEVSKLLLLDVKAATPRALPEFPDDADFLLHFAGFQGLTLQLNAEIPPERRMESLVRQLVNSGVLPGETETRQVTTWVRAVRKRERSLCHYQLKPYAGKIILLRAGDDSLSPQHELDADDITQGWGQLASGDVQAHMVPGNHLTMMSPPHLKKLAETLRAVLESEATAQPTLEPVMPAHA